jgi:2,3-bisphosphoglycerate-independent phosphoglycerate mutase
VDTKTLIIVLDGAPDHPHSSLNGHTPLSFAQTPNLDQIARRGVTGLVDVIEHGRIPVSSSGAMSLLGYDVFEHYPGETMLEAIGLIGDGVRNGDLVVHVSFATGDGRSKLLDRRVCRDLSDSEANITAQGHRDRVCVT